MVQPDNTETNINDRKLQNLPISSRRVQIVPAIPAADHRRIDYPKHRRTRRRVALVHDLSGDGSGPRLVRRAQDGGDAPLAPTEYAPRLTPSAAQFPPQLATSAAKHPFRVVHTVFQSFSPGCFLVQRSGGVCGLGGAAFGVTRQLIANSPNASAPWLFSSWRGPP